MSTSGRWTRRRLSATRSGERAGTLSNVQNHDRTSSGCPRPRPRQRSRRWRRFLTVGLHVVTSYLTSSSDDEKVDGPHGAKVERNRGLDGVQCPVLLIGHVQAKRNSTFSRPKNAGRRCAARAVGSDGRRTVEIGELDLPCRCLRRSRHGAEALRRLRRRPDPNRVHERRRVARDNVASLVSLVAAGRRSPASALRPAHR